MLVSEEEWSSQATVFDEQAGFTTFSNFLVVERGGMAKSRFEYALPTAVVQNEDGAQQYQLALYKQAGLRTEPVHIELQLPDGAELLQSSIIPSQQDGDTLQFDLLLDADIILTVTYHQ